MRLHASIHRLKAPEAFDCWFHRITANVTYDYLRRLPRRNELRMSDLADRQLDAAAADMSRRLLRDEDRRRRIQEDFDILLSRLSPTERILIRLREVEGLDLNQLSARVGVSVGAVKLRLFRARHRLRDGPRPRQS